MAKKYIIKGLIQGIGFRPSVKRIADKIGAMGYVKNLGGCVEIAVDEKHADRLLAEIYNLPQPLITSVEESEVEGGFSGFNIVQSGEKKTEMPVITPDIATCDSCISEFYDKNNRRYLHPFISCTSCGPRYSIINSLPYDRENITMSDFVMCEKCYNEYRDIKNIRCHAQTIACNNCEPHLSYTKAGNPLYEAVNTLKNGGVVAVKDIGGYHFACMADNEQAAQRLREIKNRETKPFAVMFNSIGDIKEYADISEPEEKTLLSAARPIVLVKKKKDFAPSVCGSSDYIGAFLPSNSVQHYLTKKCGALVMTSANISGEPIITENEQIFNLKQKTDGFEILSHNRRILMPLDDSICRVICGRVQMIRRARGFVPMPIEINSKNDNIVLAAGSDLKASFCYASGSSAYMSQYFGDLENVDVYDAWESSIKRLGALLGIKNYTFISDLHPAYFSSQFKRGEKLQHHYAHMASVMAEHKLNGSALGFIFDGTGYGEDGNIWGGEVIKYDGEFKRIASLEYTTLLGGDESAKNSELTLDCFLIAGGLKPIGENAEIVNTALKNGVNTVQSSSMGRLFDAVSALLDISKYNTYESESAILLESSASKAKTAYPLILKFRENKWQTADLIRDIYDVKHSGTDINSLALGFHMAIINAVTEFAVNQNEKNIILSGGAFANKILTEALFEALTEKGYYVYISEQVPTNDGGLALGQAWYMLNKE